MDNIDLPPMFSQDQHPSAIILRAFRVYQATYLDELNNDRPVGKSIFGSQDIITYLNYCYDA